MVREANPSLTYGNNTTTSIGSRTLITNTYGSDNYSLTKSTFGNGDVINYTYDDMGRVVEISNDENTLAKYIYNKKGAIARVIDVASGTNTDYWYNISGIALNSTSYNANGEVVYCTSETTDTDGNSITVSAIGGATRVVTSGVDENDNSFVNNDGWTNTLTMDSFGRVINKATVPSSGSTFTSTYTYLEGSADNSTTEFIEDIAVKYGETDIITYTYEYDANGNITKEYHNGVRKYIYTYDSLNQLVAVNNYVDNTYTTYAYDNGGNVIRETVNNINPTNGDIISVQSDITYTYGDSEWKDLLTEYNGQTITYDQVGNPLTYRDGMTFTWQNGRELATLTKDGNTISYTYDSNGIRTQKNNGGTVTKYFYDESNNLISLVQGDTQLVFYYDADGQADSFVIYSGDTQTRYYYVKNLQGDVTKILTADGAVIANYYYDAYGKLLSTTNAEENEIADVSSVAFLNPLRYRGYVYDSDTGLYYLQSRYYDPDTCRFINADVYVDTALGVLGTNMYAYCENMPVNNYDPNGEKLYIFGIERFWKKILRELKTLTNDTLKYDEENGSVSIRKKVNLNTKYKSTRLLRDIINGKYTVRILVTYDGSYYSPKRSTCYHPDKPNKFIRGSGSGGTVYIDVDLYDKRNPLYIIIAHELIHAYRAMKGVYIKKKMSNKYACRLEEVYTVGLYKPYKEYYYEVPYTENNIRKEFNLPQRTYYRDWM